MDLQSVLLTITPVIFLLALVDVVLKGIALWKAGRNGQKHWFIALFIFNTVGLLPLLYLVFFQKKAGKK